MTGSEALAQQQMNRMYKLTRHVYDASRKYYLLGRDRLIHDIRPTDKDHVCEIGCGTARNLIKLAKTYPKSLFFGIDASDEMLKTARKSLQKNDFENRPLIAQGFAQSFNPADTFGLSHDFDKIVFSYALSIIPPWKDALENALRIVKPGGEIHIVDFGGQENLPAFFRAFLFWWLSLFHVYHKPEIYEHLRTLEAQGRGKLTYTALFGGYAYYAVFTKAL